MKDPNIIFNERVKLFAALSVALGVSTMILAAIRPIISTGQGVNWPVAAAGFAIWSLSLYIVSYTRKLD